MWFGSKVGASASARISPVFGTITTTVPLSAPVSFTLAAVDGELYARAGLRRMLAVSGRHDRPPVVSLLIGALARHPCQGVLQRKLDAALPGALRIDEPENVGGDRPARVVPLRLGFSEQ